MFFVYSAKCVCGVEVIYIYIYLKLIRLPIILIVSVSGIEIIFFNVFYFWMCPSLVDSIAPVSAVVLLRQWIRVSCVVSRARYTLLGLRGRRGAAGMWRMWGKGREFAEVMSPFLYCYRTIAPLPIYHPLSCYRRSISISLPRHS